MIGQEIKVPLKFAVVGVVNTLAGLFVIYLCKWLFGFGDVMANTCGYSIGLALSFILNRGWTFKHSSPVLPALAPFIAIFVLAYLSNLAAVLVAINSLEMNSYVAQAVGILPYTIIFFLGNRHVVFVSATAQVRLT
jgi:putative flippase GtrA